MFKIKSIKKLEQPKFKEIPIGLKLIWNDTAYTEGNKYHRNSFEVKIESIESLGNSSAYKHKTFRDSDGRTWTEDYLLENINSGSFTIM